MKVIDLAVANVRGVRTLELTPDGGNFLLWGPNGSGKSAVVDALDFLLTGHISRLRGKGTAGISLDKHGPHIDSTPSDAVVRARILLRGIKTPIALERSMAKPNVLRYDETYKVQLEPILQLASRGQQTLTRREILKYITAEAGTRAQEIQALLNLSEIEDIRKAIVRVYNDSEKEASHSRRTVEQSKATVKDLAGLSQYAPADVLRFVNEQRHLLAGASLDELSAASIKAQISSPSQMPQQQINPTLVVKDIETLQTAFRQEQRQQVEEIENQLRAAYESVASHPDLLRSHNREQLIRIGLSLLDETGTCPLCESAWPQGELRNRFEVRLEQADKINKERQRLRALTDDLSSRAARVLPVLERLIGAIELATLTEAAAQFRAWRQHLKAFSTSVTHFSAHFPGGGPYSAATFIPDADAVTVLGTVLAAVSSMSQKPSPEQTAWDELTRLEQAVDLLEKAETSQIAAEAAFRRATVLLKSFESARDTVLDDLYDSIKERFEYLYRKLHGNDEANFAAKLQPEGAGLNLEVDFYGRGLHPPHALHSEGHQDSMGVCLYLALSEPLAKGFMDLMILDDVVMSVDAEHRRALCHLLKEEFPGRQFLITTHDRTWAKQLQIEGVVLAKNATEFYDWRVETGPQVNRETDLWSKIEADLKKGDVPPAAARLRRGTEEFFASVCDSLQAPVRYKLSGRWELGDWLPAAMAQFKVLLRKAKNSAQSWNHTEDLENVTNLDSTAGQIFKRTNAEQWGVNAAVHYNQWFALERKDFEPIVEAFKDLHDLFICRKCGGLVCVATTGAQATGLRCSCGKYSLNLVAKSEAVVSKAV